MGTDRLQPGPVGSGRLRLRAAGAAVGGGVVGLLLALAARASLPVGTLFLWKAVGLFAAATTVVVCAIPAHHPHGRFGPANQLTLLRAVLVSLLAGLLGEPVVPALATTAVTIAICITVLDGLDGWLARRSRLQSLFGARFDMEVDALFVLVLSILVWQHDRAGAWILIGGLLRYAFVAAGWLLPWMAGPLRPTRRARVVTVCHLVGLMVALAPIVPATLGRLAAATSLLLLVWSFALDVRRLWRGASTPAPMWPGGV